MPQSCCASEYQHPPCEQLCVGGLRSKWALARCVLTHSPENPSRTKISPSSGCLRFPSEYRSPSIEPSSSQQVSSRQDLGKANAAMMSSARGGLCDRAFSSFANSKLSVLVYDLFCHHQRPKTDADPRMITAIKPRFHMGRD